MKDQQQSSDAPGVGLASGAGSVRTPSERRGKVKPQVPPRRNPPPPESGSDNPRGKVVKTSSILVSRDRVSNGQGGCPGADSSPGKEFGPRVTSSSASSLCSSSSTPLPPEGEDQPTKGRGSEVTPKPSVTFDPNPTILAPGSDGSPVKIANKGGVKRFALGGENIPEGGGDNVPVSVLKKSNDGPQAQLESAARSKPDEPDDCHLQELYSQISDVVASKPDEIENINEDEAEDPAAVPMIWISKWVDYSDKYGLGYQLSDDSIGVLFNDFTKMMLLPDGENIHYIERSGQENYHRLSDFPHPLYKKVTLLRYFRNYMNEHLLKAGASMSARDGDELARIPSLKTYFRTRSAIILHLTNGTLQINFFEDHTKIILCPLMGAVTYIDKKRNFRTYRLDMLKKFGCSVDLANRLRYGRNMIQKLLLTKSGSSSKGLSSVSSTAQQPSQAKQTV